MRHKLIAGLIAGSTLAICGAANAATILTFASYGVALPAGETMATDFSTPTVPGSLSQVIFDLSGFALSGDAALLTGSSGAGAAPATSPTTRDSTQYLSVEKGDTATLTTPVLSAISFYVGSLDPFNSITFTHKDGTTETFTGTSIDTMPALLGTIDDNGNQQEAKTNGRLTFTFTDPITMVQLSSGSNSFEVADIATSVVGVIVEPSSWAMMLVGFGGIGALLRRRRTLNGMATA